MRWTPYNLAKKFLCDGTVAFGSGQFRVALYTASSNAADDTGLSVIEQLTGAIAGTTQAVTGTSWGSGRSATEMVLKCDTMVWSGPLSGVRNSVVWDDYTGKLLAVLVLDADYNVASGHTFGLDGQAGIFALS